MNFKNIPQPIPYQGSKRKQVPIILRYIPKDTVTLWEPFVGSGATTIGAALTNAAQRFVVGDSLEPLIGIWRLILTDPDSLCDAYEKLWNAQIDDPRSYYNLVRDEFNQTGDPVRLLYLIVRCVKNAVRFNREGMFNQSPDNRRLGVRPAILRARVQKVHAALSGRTSAICADYSEALAAAEERDVVYMDPPYMGVSDKRNPRYHQGLDYARFVEQLDRANNRSISYIVSFDGHCGTRSYGPGLPEKLGLRKIDVYVGRSSQATLNGKNEETVESLYLSPAIQKRLQDQEAVVAIPTSVKIAVAHTTRPFRQPGS